ncbi:MAG: DUF192 domain-containing protein [Methanobacterium sp.]|nr:DUF192 domain-containing protein [Methanobacterium sp.]
MPNYSKGFLIINITKNNNLGYADLADSFLSRFKGLMLKGKIERGLVLTIPEGRGRRGSGIHMFFMRIPLDIIFLDKDKKVVDTVYLKPWQTYNPKKPARYVIELEKGMIKSSNTEIGDELDFTCDQV